MSLKVVQVELAEANALIKRWHRHHKEVQGHRFSIGVLDDKTGQFVGAATVGRPVARLIDYRKTLEVTRLVTDGTKNACSILYSSAARIARELGYEKIQTYILDEELGTSLIASGWECEGSAGGGAWNISRPDRRTDQPITSKKRWSKALNEPLRCDIHQALDGIEVNESDGQYSLFAA